MEACPDFEPYVPECGVHRDGAGLHRDVPPDHWCVTKADLEKFRDCVRQLVAQGLIKPTARDPFDVSDGLIGPKIYTVNQQLIKPVTARAGNASWALMLHPEGIKCELFVTHSWKEGIFEFLDKVLNSWPCRACSAYCCMLSNPQNLNIGALIGSPRDSPFAHALRTSRFVLVVPNRECSIYSRIWCVYEAFLAYQESKIILTATAPVLGVRWHVLRVFLLFCSLYAATWAWITCEAVFPRSELQQWFTEGFMTTLQGTAYVSLLVSSFVVPGQGALVLICLSASFAAVTLALNHLVLYELGPQFLQQTPYSMAVDSFLSTGIGVSSIIAEAVRLRRLQSNKESEQLLKDYTGRLWDAQSSQPEDKVRIMAELADSVPHKEVEDAIQVLLDQGISTPTLREAGARAGRLRQAGYVSSSTLVMTLFSWFYLPLKNIGWIIEEHKRLSHNGMCDICSANANAADLCVNCILPPFRPPVWISTFGFLQTVTWVILFAFLPKDKRGFALAAVVRIGVLLGGLIIFVTVLVNQTNAGEDHLAHGIIQLGLVPITMMLSVAGPGLAARTPIIGPWVVRQVMLPLGVPACRAAGQKSAD